MLRKGQASELTSHVVCRRLNVERSAAEHRSCAYCFGEVAAVASGDHALFCDYEAGADPVCFGFPEGSSRIERG